MANKYIGVVIRDEDEEGDYGDYRDVVDLDSGRTSDGAYGGKKKGWLAVCEVLPGLHNKEISDAGARGPHSIPLGTCS